VVAPDGCFCDEAAPEFGDECSDWGICAAPPGGQTGAEPELCPDGYGSKSSNWLKKADLWLWKQDLDLFADTWGSVLGWDEAASYLRHYMEGSGETLEADVDQMLRDISSFEEKVEDGRIRLGEERVAERRQQGRVPLIGDWDGHSVGFSENKNWYMALRSWNFRHIGDVNVQSSSSPWQFTAGTKVEIEKDYNFDPDESVLGYSFEHAAELHCYGWAREYKVRGTSSEDSYTGTFTE
jgi:hypothetical protein